ncbi:LysE family translocator [Allokutzneria sp. A3M-2-11 16]|uniref:LysE family translocator n=1 Tax=Allokutzneria sp. A3M-2-11 16 TaxID=2962043 RepID=UPI0020B8C608|nr:LysE family translocator [Allokutzneria sp. A3M-2-11 16]MCP3800367.1 LysE family translocator [Allokutzneria sp. A3M-2-11 16]
MSLFDGTTLATYVAACFALVLVPGPAQALVLVRTANGGRRAGVLTTLGLSIGTLVHTAAAAIGLSALLAGSAVAFSILKYLGAAYLVYLAYRAWRDGSEPVSVAPSGIPGRKVFTSAVLTGVLNPKTALFFLAFLPQFVHPERGWVVLQFLVLGLVLAVVGVLTDCVLAVAAGALTTRLTRNRRFHQWRQRVTATVFLALGVRLALTEQS